MTFFYDLNKKLADLSAPKAQTINEDRAMGEGNPYAHAVLKAKQAGAKPGDKIDGPGPGSQDITIKEKMSPVRAKKFAALAPPKDKITFADKIVGAKKEVDEMLGDVAAKAMKKAVGVGDQEVDEGWEDMLKYVRDRDMQTGEKRKTSRGEVEKTSTGVIHRRSYDPKTGETDTGDDSPAAGEKRGRGRPKGTGGPRQERVTAKSRKTDRTAHGQTGFKTAGKKKVKEDDFEAMGEDSSKLKAAMALLKKAGYKVSKQELDEKAVSKKQQKFMGMVHAAQKGEKPASPEVAKVAKEMPKKAAKDFAATKHKGLPEKVKSKKKEESVEETTSSGSVATSTEAPKSKKGGMQFGKGVYEAALAESFKSALTTVLNEDMSVNISMDSNGQKTINVTASNEDADKLAELLNLAGVQHSGAEACPTCNEAPCNCAEQVDENQPDWPTNKEVSDDALQYSGGLNAKKSTGQTTVPVIASQLNRQVAHENVDLERSLWNLYKELK